MALPGTSGLQRVDRVHLVPGGDQRGDPRATVGLDPDLHPGAVAVLGQEPPDQAMKPSYP